jgi:hypothetical protein
LTSKKVKRHSQLGTHHLMVALSISVTSDWLKNIPRPSYRNDFTFLAGECAYSCPWYVAAILSTRIRRLHEVDPTISEFVVTTTDPGGQFEKFLSLGFGETFTITDANRAFITALARELLSTDVLISIVNDAFQGGFTVSNAIDRFLLLSSETASVDEVIAFIASHFYEFPLSSFDSLSCVQLGLILGHPLLKLSSEDAVCELLLSRSAADFHFVSLFEYLQFEYLSVETMFQFCDFLSEDLARLSPSVWNGVRRRLLSPIAIVRQSLRFCSLDFPLSKTSPLDGIISYLTRQCGGNVHKHWIVTITGEEYRDNDPECAACNAADLTTYSVFGSKNEPNQSLVYDFGDRRVKLTHYSIATHAPPGCVIWGGGCLCSWVIEGSTDGKQWSEIHRRPEGPGVNGGSKDASFEVQGDPQEYRFLRLRQTGSAARDSEFENRLVIRGLEFFGSLIQ